MMQWWRQLEADVAAVDPAFEHEHQAAIAAGKPWPLQHESGPVRGPQSSPGSDLQADGRPGPDDQTARLGSRAFHRGKRLTGKPEPTTQLVSNEKPMPNQSVPCRPKPHTRQNSSCSHAVRAMTVLAPLAAILRVRC